MTAERFHLAWFMSNGFGVQSWNDRWSGTTGREWMKADFYVDMARSLERACFDYMIIEDSSYVPNTYRGTSETYLKYAYATPKHDPTTLAPILAYATNRLGIVPTLSTTEYEPYMLARKMSSLDHLSDGRIGWNIVTSSNDLAAQNYGHDGQPPHDVRYDMADEFVDVVCRLWDSWEPDAVVMDREANVFADFTKVHTIDFEGEHYKSRGPLNCAPSPQGRPVFVQAGSSDRGKMFAARHAETVITPGTNIPAMKAMRDAVREAMVEVGRKPDDCKVLFLVAPLVDEEDAGARDRLERMQGEEERAVDMALAQMSRHTGIDFSQFPLDEPIPELSTNGHQSALARAVGKTPRELAVGPPTRVELMGSPDTVAAKMQETMEEVGGDGFLISSRSLTRRFISEITDGLVPALQKRGLVRTDYTYPHFRDNLLEF